MAPREFDVEIQSAGRATKHRVQVPDRIGDTELGNDLERVVRESFDFLLEREPASSILHSFSLTEIAKYFPEYPVELSRRLDVSDAG